jgi:hypothetical protein
VRVASRVLLDVRSASAVPDPSTPSRAPGTGALARARRGLLGTVDVLAAPVRAASRWEAAAQRPGPLRVLVARPGLVALVAALVVFVGSAVHLQRFESSLGPGSAEDQVVAEPGDAPVAEIGPRVGSDLGAYVERRREVLADLDGEREIRAVVSFDAYLDAASLGLPEELIVERLLVRLPILDAEPREIELEGRDPARLLTAVAEEERERLAEEEAELTSLLESDVDDEEFAEEFERRLEEVAEVRERLTDAPALLYAAVVVGRVDTLVEVQASERVRLVDPGGDESRTRGTRFFGLLPDDGGRASHGRSI